jgi:hypothetical protein
LYLQYTKMGNIYQIAKNRPNGHKNTNIFDCNTLQNLPKSWFLVQKHAIWRHWCAVTIIFTYLKTHLLNACKLAYRKLGQFYRIVPAHLHIFLSWWPESSPACFLLFCSSRDHFKGRGKKFEIFFSLTVGPGVDVMIKIFWEFRQFSAKKLAIFSKTNVMIKFLNNLA